MWKKIACLSIFPGILQRKDYMCRKFMRYRKIGRSIYRKIWVRKLYWTWSGRSEKEIVCRSIRCNFTGNLCPNYCGFSWSGDRDWIMPVVSHVLYSTGSVSCGTWIILSIVFWNWQERIFQSRRSKMILSGWQMLWFRNLRIVLCFVIFSRGILWSEPERFGLSIIREDGKGLYLMT